MKSRREKAIYYGVMAMAISILHSMFVTFFMDYFLRVNKLSLLWFTSGQVIYALWNSLNDLGFGWWGDKKKYQSTYARRVKRIGMGGVWWAVIFVCIWVPFDWVTIIHPAVQFTLLLIIYDGFFSYTTVAFRALLVDIASSSQERETCNAYAAAFHVLGSTSVGVASFLYDPNGPGSDGPAHHASLRGFRVFVACAAVFAAICFRFTTVRLAAVMRASDEQDESSEEHGMSLLQFATQISKSPSMRCALLFWAVQEYSCTFATNFFPLFLFVVSGHRIPAIIRSTILVCSFFLPHAFTLLITPHLPRIGKKRVISVLFATRFFVGISMLFLGRGIIAEGTVSLVTAIVFALLLLSNRVLTECVCRLEGLVAADLCDEDQVVNKRDYSMASSVHGLLALASKPSQSIAPVITCYLLAYIGVISTNAAGSDITSSIEDYGIDRTAQAAAKVAIVTGGTIASVCFILFTSFVKWYTLDGEYLAAIRRQTGKNIPNDSHEL